MTDGDYQPPGFVGAPNRFISGNVKRGTLHLFDNGRFVPNTADALNSADVDVLRARGHRIVADVAPGTLGTIEAILAERQRKSDALQAQLREAIGKGDQRAIGTLQPQTWEARGLLSAALEARAREIASGDPGETRLSTPVQPQARW